MYTASHIECIHVYMYVEPKDAGLGFHFECSVGTQSLHLTACLVRQAGIVIITTSIISSWIIHHMPTAIGKDSYYPVQVTSVSHC